jgi:hypothetical protein
LELLLRMLILVPLIVATSAGGGVFITIRIENRPVANAEVKVICANQNFPARTANDGSFRLYVQDSGRCTVAVAYDGQWPEAVFYSNPSPAEYYFNLVGNRGQGYRLEPAPRR